MQAKCPHCKEALNHLQTKREFIGDLGSGPVYPAVLVTCPSCKSVLGVLNDPDVPQRRMRDEGYRGPSTAVLTKKSSRR
jgi:phage FluMu protein Com